MAILTFVNGYICMSIHSFEQKRCNAGSRYCMNWDFLILKFFFNVVSKTLENPCLCEALTHSLETRKCLVHERIRLFFKAKLHHSNFTHECKIADSGENRQMIKINIHIFNH